MRVHHLPSGRLRVAVVTESFLPSVNGVARSVARVVDHLRTRGHEVVVITPGEGPDRFGDVPVVRLPSVSLPLCRAFPAGIPTPRLRATLEEFGPDVVHLASPILVGARGMALARDLGVPTVAIFQTDVAGFAASYGLRAVSRGAWRWLARVHRHADRTLAPSRPVVAELGRHGIERVHRWGRGVDLDDFHPRMRTRRATDAVDVVRVGFVGRLAAEKRVERLAPVLDLPGVEVVVVGDGDRRERLERQLPGARFTGMLTGEDLHRAYADLDVFVHTGEHETFCQAVQEALSAGVPVVAPASGGPLDLIDHGTNGLLWQPGVQGALLDAVAALVADPARRVAMGRAAHAGVQGRSWAAVGDELLGHYRAVLGERTADATGVAAA